MSQKNSDRQSSKSKTVGNINVTGDENPLNVIQGDRNNFFQILLKGVTLQLPGLSNRQRRFSQAVAIGIYVSCILAGFIRLIVEQDAGLATKSLLTIGSVLLALTYCYYSWPWDLKTPEKKEKQKYEAVGEDPEKEHYRIMSIEKKYKEYEEVYEKEKNKVFKQIIRGKCIAIASLITIPLLTYGGFYVGRYIMPTDTIVSIANYFNSNVEQAQNITDAVRDKLDNLDKDISIRSIGKAFQNSEDARRAGNDRFSAIIIWGSFEEFSEELEQQEEQVKRIKTQFELLKSLPDLPKEAKMLEAEQVKEWLNYQDNLRVPIYYPSLRIEEINPSSEKDPLTSELAYLIWFTLGLTHYEAENWNNAIGSFDTALEYITTSGSLEAELDTSFVEFFRSNTEARKAKASEVKDGYDAAIEGYTKAIQLVEAILQETEVSHPLDNFVTTRSDYEAILTSYPLVSQNQPELDLDNNDQEKICENTRPDEPLLVDSSPAKLELYLARIYHNRGVVYALKDDPERALSDYTAAWRLDPEMDSLCLALGTAYNDLSQYDAAIKNLDGGLGVNFTDPSAHNNLGNAYANRGDTDQNDYENAIKEYTHAINQKRDFAEAYYNRGRTYLLRIGEDNKNSAIKNFSEAIKLKPDFAEAYYGRGVSYLAQRNRFTLVSNFDPEVRDFQEAIKLEPNFVEAYYILGKLSLNNAEVSVQTTSEIVESEYFFLSNSKAIENLNKVIQLRPDLEAQVKLDLAKSYYNLGMYYDKGANAIENFSRAIQLNPDYVEAYNLRARGHIANENYSSAIADCNQVMELMPDNAEAYSIRGIVFLEQGKVIQAIADFNKAIELEANFSEPYYELGKIYFDQGDYNQAIAMLNEATKWSNDVELYRLRADAYRMEGDYEQAIADLNQVVRLDPSNFNSYYTLGIIYAGRGNSDAAIENFTKVVQLSPEQSSSHQSAQNQLRNICQKRASMEIENDTDQNLRVKLLSSNNNSQSKEALLNARQQYTFECVTPGNYLIEYEFPNSDIPPRRGIEVTLEEYENDGVEIWIVRNGVSTKR